MEVRVGCSPWTGGRVPVLSMPPDPQPASASMIEAIPAGTRDLIADMTFLSDKKNPRPLFVATRCEAAIEGCSVCLESTRMKPKFCLDTEKRDVARTVHGDDTQNVTDCRRRPRPTSPRADGNPRRDIRTLLGCRRRVQKNACHCRKTSVEFCALFCGMPLFLRTPNRNWVNWKGVYSYTAL